MARTVTWAGPPAALVQTAAVPRLVTPPHPNVPDVLRLVETAEIECPVEVDTASYFVSTIELRRGAAPTMSIQSVRRTR